MSALGVLGLSSFAKEFDNTAEKYDLIVVGAGSAGMPCAITAAEQGAKVLVIEKSDRVGGTLHLSAGHLSAGGTRRQKAMGIDDSPQKHYEDVMRICRHTADPDLVRLAVYEAPHTIDWLEELGFPFAPDTPKIVYGHVPYQIPRTYWGIEAARSILQTLMPLWEKYLASGNITLKLQHQLTDLLVKKDRVVGIRAYHNGKKLDFFANNTVLCTGGYASNPDFFARVHPTHSRLLSTAALTSTGEGIIIAQRIGANFRGAEKHLGSLGGIELEPGSGRVDFWNAWAMVFTPKYRPPREIYVNAQGERFMNEDELNPDVRERLVAQQPEEKFWLIFDDASIDDGEIIIRAWKGEQIRAAAKEEKFIWQANSLQELATKTGLPAQSLIRTVEAYNQAVRTKNDPHFGRTTLTHAIAQPPFYAMLSYTSSLITFGGLQVNAHLQVINTKGKPIEGLYAAGEILGAGATSGNAFCGGMALTPAISFGRILGKKLAKRN
ncbi:MAG: FAD-dependent oxidoreductase [Cytophagales bacterium]|nr:FAD-dependent oxidoreductase [Cytophagales bacterium]